MPTFNNNGIEFERDLLELTPAKLVAFADAFKQKLFAQSVKNKRLATRVSKIQYPNIFSMLFFVGLAERGVGGDFTQVFKKTFFTMKRKGVKNAKQSLKRAFRNALLGHNSK